MTPPTPDVPPGWYADPWQPGATRWWDGTSWTPHAGPAMQVRPDPLTTALHQERSLRKWARIAAAALPLAMAVSVIVIASTYDEVIDRSFEQLDHIGDPEPTVEFAVPPEYLLLSLQTPILLLVGVWIMRVAQVGKGLGRAMRREPGWGLGALFLPVVNLWFPYEAIADSLDERADRRPLLRWWVSVAALLALNYLAVVVAFTDAPLAVFAVPVVIAGLVGAATGVGAVDVVSADHDAAVPGVR